MEKITAWVYNPRKSIFKGSSNDKARLFEVTCEDPSKCDVYTKCQSCVLTSSFGSCKYGKKKVTVGYTKRARKFTKWIDDAQRTADSYPKVETFRGSNRIFKIGEFWCIPNSISSILGNKVKKWVPADEMTPELLEMICTSRPTNLVGDVIKSYQEDAVPKLISDLSANYPDLFDMLSPEQQQRLEKVNYEGRSADITTCNPGNYIFGSTTWKWDGTNLTTNRMLFAPAPGEILVQVTPNKGSPVMITSNDQVNNQTVFLD